MSTDYEIIGDVVVKNRPSGKQDYVCHIGDLLSIGWDNSANQMIAHGDVTNVARIMQVFEDFAKNASSDAGLSADFSILCFEATEDSVCALNSAINDPASGSALLQRAEVYDESRLGIQPCI